MNQPRSGDGARRLGVEGCHTRAAFHGPSHCGWGVALEVQGGWSKVQRQDLVPDHCPSHRRVFFLFPAFSRGGADRWAEWGHRPSWGFRPPKRCATSLRLPCQPDPGAIARRVCDHGQRVDFRRINFSFSERHSGSDDLQGNNGNMGTSYVKQAESRDSGGCEPVPKLSGRFGNMGTEMADPDAGKSARVWRPRTPSSR